MPAISASKRKGHEYPSEIDNDQLKATIKTDSLNTIQEVAKTHKVDYSTVGRHLNPTEKTNNTISRFYRS